MVKFTMSSLLALLLCTLMVLPVGAVSRTEKQINEEILTTAHKYMAMTEHFPDPTAGALYLVAATSPENRGSGNSDIFSGVRMTPEVYSNNPGALVSFSHNNSYGLQTYQGAYLGPLSLSSGYLGDAIAPQDYGKIGASDGIRYDINGSVGDRQNWYDACNMATKKLDDIWGVYNRSEFERGLNSNNPYTVVAITSIAMGQGESVLTMPDDWMPSGQAENASPRFWFDWCNILTKPAYIQTIREYVRKEQPDTYANSEKINNDLIIPILNEAKRDALVMREDFFDTHRYSAGNSWIGGNTSYTGYVGSAGEKTSLIVKVLVSYIIMEERYNQSY